MSAQSFQYNPAAKYLFKRCYAVALGAPNQTSAVQYSNLPYTGADGRIQPASPLRVTFDIKKNLLGTPNKSKIEIYNLSPQTRQMIKKGWIMQVRAGYMGLLETIFIGNVMLNGIKSERKGPGIVTSIECGDGESAISQPVLNKTYPPGTTLAAVLSDLARQMSATGDQNPFGVNAGIAIGIPNETFGRGYSVQGKVSATLTKLLEPRGLRWSVQNGNLNIIPVLFSNGQTAITLSPQSGLIGVPSKNDNYVEMTSFLNPKLVPTALVNLESKQNAALNGIYKILNTHIEGDSHDQKWQCALQCTALPNAGVQNLKASGGFDYAQAVV